MSPAPSSRARRNDEFFRCPIAPEQNAATLRIGRRTIHASLQEASIDGFTVLVESSDANRLVLGKPWILFHDKATLEVHAQWFFHADDGNVQIGLRRLRDLTKPPMIGGWFPSFGGGAQTDGSSGSMIFVSAVLIALASLAMPGVGDTLGTSGKIQDALAAIYQSVRSFF